VAANLLLGRLGPNMSLLLEALGAGEDMAAALRSFGVTYADLNATSPLAADYRR